MWIPFGREFLTAETLAGVRGSLSSDVEVFAMGGLGFGDTLGNLLWLLWFSRTN
jgi:hypothetical protein